MQEKSLAEAKAGGKKNKMFLETFSDSETGGQLFPAENTKLRKLEYNSTGDANVCYLFIQSLIHLELSLGIKWRAELPHLMYSGRVTNHPW